MEIIQMNRGRGKTIYLIKKSAELKYPIICCSEAQRKMINRAVYVWQLFGGVLKQGWTMPALRLPEKFYKIAQALD